MTAAPVGARARYARFSVGRIQVVSLPEAAIGVRTALAVCRTLHGWASTLPGATAHQGRATAWGAVLPGGDIHVVVRHAQHGGLLRSITGDRFLGQGRAAYELEVSERLRAAGVPTPELVAYVIYPAGVWFSRVDVATRRLPAGDDLPSAWAAAGGEERDAMIDATAALLRTLERAGALHPDLNAKNIYLSRGDDAHWRAYVLDVDRIRFPSISGAPLRARNLARLQRSLLKWHTRHRLPITADHLTRLRSLAASGGPA